MQHGERLTTLASRLGTTIMVVASLCLLPGTCAHAASDTASLPDAPTAATAAPASRASGDFPGGASESQSGRLRADPKAYNFQQPTQPLSAGEKLKLSFMEQLTPYAFFTEALSAGWEQLRNSDPKYGSDSAGFGERLGAAAIRQSSESVFADGVFAAAFHQDPRFYRLGKGSFPHRVFYAASRTWRTRMDSGTPAMNYSLLVGYGASSALTMAYYPAISATGSKAAAGYGWSLLGNMAGDQYHEFWPDISRKVFHHEPASQ
jgi:hypothetical protein